VDLAALLLRCSEEQIVQLIEEGAGRGSIRTAGYIGEPHPWALLRRDGVKRSATGFGPRALPARDSLEHRREVIGALLLLRKEKPGWGWICEATFHNGRKGSRIPDGVLKRGKKRWAIEVQRSYKSTGPLREKLMQLCSEYDQVVYFAPPETRLRLEAFKEASREFSNLQVRPLPGETAGQSRPQWQSNRSPYTPSPDAFRVLQFLCQEGFVFGAQLPRALGWKPSKVARILKKLEENNCIRRGLEVDNDGGWVWCNTRGYTRSGTGLCALKMPSRGALAKRIVQMEVRLDVFARWPESSWLTQRVIGRGLGAKAQGLPIAVVERGGLRYAVMVLESLSLPKVLGPRVQQWEKEYAGVLCYHPWKLGPRVEKFTEEYQLTGVEPRTLPRPPKSAPYQSLEDEWRTGKEPYQPTEDQLRLLRLVSTAGMIWKPHLHRLLKCSVEEAKRQVRVLQEEHNCLFVEGEWILCNRRAARLSKTGMAPPFVPDEECLERYREEMEIRLDLMERFPSLDWKTRRELLKEVGGRWAVPSGIATIDAKRHAIVILSGRERSIKRLVEQLSRWSEANHDVWCYCDPEDVERFKRMLERYGLGAVELMGHPEATAKRRALQAAKKAAQRKRRQKCKNEKDRVRHAVAAAVRSGRLIKPSKCQNGHAVESPTDLHGHHRDYSKPLEVEWLCRKCHGKKHRSRKRSRVGTSS
jgi:hypothetical protein